MKIYKLTTSQKDTLSEALSLYKNIHAIFLAIQNAGGRVFIVGGFVRDLVMNIQSKDIDIEAHDITLESLSYVLQKFGAIDYVGKVFGVLKLAHLPIDWSIPRADSCGRKPIVALDPGMDIKQALRRRDLTMNALALDVVAEEVLDPFDGVEDIAAKRLRTPDPDLFVQDPLRFYRVMQMVGRFGMTPDHELNAVCKKIDISSVSVERIDKEFCKLFSTSKEPSRGLRWLDSIDRLADVLPEIACLKGVPQRPDYHPEGDVFEHTMQAVDAAACQTYPHDKQRILIATAALCHDLGKAVTTTLQDGVIKSHEHEIAGVPLARALLKRITRRKTFIDQVAVLVRYHMVPRQLVKQKSSPAAYKRLAGKVAPLASLDDLALLAYADSRGRCLPGSYAFDAVIPEVDVFRMRARDCGVLYGPEPAVLQGRDLLPYVQPGAEMGRLLRRAYHSQIEKSIGDKEELLKRILEHKEE